MYSPDLMMSTEDSVDADSQCDQIVTDMEVLLPPNIATDEVDVVPKSTPSNDIPPLKGKRAHFLSQNTYDQVLYKTKPKELPPDLRKIIGKLARNYDLEDDGSSGDWPKGKTLHKIFWTRNNLRKGTKLYVPPNEIDRLIKHFHQNGASKHHGWVRTFQLITANHAGVSEHVVREYCNKCVVCLSFTNVQKKPRLKPILSVGVMDRMQVDLKEFTFYQEWNDGYSYMLTVIDHFSSYPWAFPLFTKTAKEVSYHLVNLFFMFGPPRILHSDNGGEFVNELIQSISKVLHFECAHGKAYNPREQGKVEKLNGTISSTLSKLMFERNSKRWIDMLDETLFSYRVTNGVAKQTPFQIFFLRPPHFVYHFPGSALPEISDPEVNVLEQQEIIDAHSNLIESVRELREKNAAKMKARWDTKNTQRVEVGNYVLVDPRAKTKQIKKKAVLGERIYSMPGVVLVVNANGNILVRYKNGEETPIDRPVPNNQFKVIDLETFNSVEIPDGEDEENDFVLEGEVLDGQANENNATQLLQTRKTTTAVLIPAPIERNISNISLDRYLTLPDGWNPIPKLKVSIFWNGDQKWYDGQIVKFIEKEKKWSIAYHDGDRSKHTFRPEKWRVFSDQPPRLLKTFLKSIESLNVSK